MSKVLGKDYDIAFDGKTVWISDRDGGCLGRYTRRRNIGLVDVHRTTKDQLSLGVQCLDCSDASASEDHATAWARFRASMNLHHGIDVAPEFEPFPQVHARAKGG